MWKEAFVGLDGILQWMENEDAGYTAEQLRGMAKKARWFLRKALGGDEE